MSADWEKVISAEKKQGYLNGSYVGGFDAWIAELSADYAEPAATRLQELAHDYARASLLVRPVLIEQLTEVFKKHKPKPTEKMSAATADVPQPLNTSIQFLKGVGPKKAELFRRLGINTVGDLLEYYPRDYENRGDVKLIAELKEGESASVKATVLSSVVAPTGRKLTIVRALLTDGTGNLTAIWFNQRYLQKQLTQGRQMLLYGKLERRYRNAEFLVQDFEFLNAESAPPAKILPVYPSLAGLNQKNIRAAVALAWERFGSFIEETLPHNLLQQHNWPTRQQAIKALHFPRNKSETERARERLAYEELLVLQLAILSNRLPDDTPGIARPVDPECLPELLAALSFDLTGAQKRVINEIFADMEASRPMTRLVQGDVGSGKTIVAAAALYKNARAGYQGALMAPTEILARQHFESLAPMFARLGFKTGLLTGDSTAKERRELLFELESGTIDIIIGTHALFQAGVEFKNLALAITDEQHRFGVHQRSVFQSKGVSTDVLVMTATPIPRTLALTLYGDLEVSVIDELPPGRKEIKTYAIDHEKEARALNFIAKEVEAGRQAYVVCPLVEESDKIELDSAVALAERLQNKEFKQFVVGLLHGKLKPAEKDQLMQAFVQGDIQILVATTVIEVGVNVPNATVMMVRDAERFGLAQLHQLRGRVGRGAEQSHCILLHDAKTPVARERMKTMCATTDGFEIAEADLKLRGAGEFFGTRQHGAAELKVANLLKDQLLLNEARADALMLLASGDHQNTVLGRKVAELLREFTV